MYGISKSRIAYLSSINQITISDISDPERPLKKSLEIEPSIVALGNNIFAFGINNKIQFWSIENSEFRQICQKVTHKTINSRNMFLL